MMRDLEDYGQDSFAGRGRSNLEEGIMPRNPEEQYSHHHNGALRAPEEQYLHHHNDNGDSLIRTPEPSETALMEEEDLEIKARAAVQASIASLPGAFNVHAPMNVRRVQQLMEHSRRKKVPILSELQPFQQLQQSAIQKRKKPRRESFPKPL